VHRDHTVLLHGTRFHYTEWGDAAAPPVILLHGVTGHARTWDDEARALSATRRVVALDQRGHGDSDPAPDGDYTTATLCDDLATFIDSLGLAQVSLVALSMGGRVAIAYAGRYPSRVSRLVVVDIGPEIAPAGGGRVGGMMAGSPERFDSVARAIDYARTNAPRYSDAMLRHRVEHGVRPLADGGVTWKYDRAIRESVRNGRWRDPIDLWPFWSAITCPTLIIRGADSDILSAEIARRMLEAQPLAGLVEIPGAGHTVPGDQPQAFLDTLQSFLDTK
jgi:pimeloyl-ACP methyl ester carboxylesterase